MATLKEHDSRSEYQPPQGGASRILFNLASMLTSDVVNKVAIFVAYIMVGRFLGAYGLGQLALASTLFFAWHIFALVGMKALITREIARRRDLTVPCFLHASVVCLFASIFGLAAIVPFVKVMGYSHDTTQVVFLTFIGLVPYVLSQVCEAVFQGWERMQLIAYVNVPVSLLRVAAIFASLKFSYGIQGVALSIAVSYIAQLLLQWLVLVLWMGFPRLTLDFHMAVAMVRSSSTFLGIQATTAIRTSAAIIVLSKFCGETSVGIYSAASQLSVPFTLVFDNVALSLFPVMCRAYDVSVKQLAVVLRRMIEWLMIIALPAIATLFVLADVVLTVIYKDEHFLASATILRILVWSLFSHAMVSAMGRAFWASRHEKITLRITLVNTVVQFGSSIVLISIFGLLGAAASTTLTYLVNLLQHAISAARLFSRLGLSAVVWKPGVASAIMAAFLVWWRDVNLVVMIAAAATLYCFVLALLFIRSAGGFDQFKAACLDLWTT